MDRIPKEKVQSRGKNIFPVGMKIFIAMIKTIPYTPL